METWKVSHFEQSSLGEALPLLLGSQGLLGELHDKEHRHCRAHMAVPTMIPVSLHTSLVRCTLVLPYRQLRRLGLRE